MEKRPIWERVTFPWGWAEADARAPRVRVGTRFVPPNVVVHFTGADGQPTLDMRLDVVSGIPQCRELRITAAPHGREVKDLDLEAVRLAQWVPEMFALFAMEEIEGSPGVVTRVMRETDGVDAARQMAEARKGRGARKLTPEFLERVAELYAVSDAPIGAIAERWGVSERQAAKYAEMAARAGYLTDPGPGRKRERVQP